jgi:diguanylate cyclase (GGDEF)-like protein/PAS domain S-box-containing protein
MLDSRDCREFFNQISVAMSISREADGVYLDVNDEWVRLTGLSREQALGQNSVALGFWGSSSQHLLALQSLRETGQVRCLDVAFTRPDQRHIWVQLSVSRINIGEEIGYLSYLKDVTDERAAQAALLASEQLLKASNNRLSQQLRLFESLESLASVGYWTSTEDDQDVVWSKGLYGLSGKKRGAVQDGSAGRGRIHPDDLHIYKQARAMMDGKTIEFRWQHPNGQVRWHRSRLQKLAVAGEKPMIFGVVQDITRERETAFALQEKLGFIQKITSRLPGVVFQLRCNAEGVTEFLYISETASQIYPGFTDKDILRDANCTLVLHHPDDLAGFRASVAKTLQMLEPWQHEYRLLSPSGEVRWLFGQGIPERAEDGSVLVSGFVSDITARKLSQERLRQSEARFRSLTELSSDWYWEQDEHFRFVRIDGNQDAISTFPAEQYVGVTRWHAGVSGVSSAQWARHRAALEAHEVFHDFEMQRMRPDGSMMWASVSGAPIFDDQGKFSGYRGIGRDISERKAAEEKIEHLAFYDALTGLPNRRLLIERLQLALQATARHDLYSAVLFIDLDNFKDLNDSLGHDVGDSLLRQVAQRLQTCVREVDTVARLGGDEFVVVLEELGADLLEVTARVEQMGQQILGSLNQVYELGQLEHHSTPSVGVALLSRAVQSVDELLKQADLAMYESKAAGRNTMRFFDPAMQALVAHRTSVEHDLRLGLKRGELVLFYQPVVDHQACVVGVEALVRWQHPERGLVLPAEFIPIAEQTGLILPLGQWVLMTACEQLVSWAADAQTACLSVSVNVSARQFRHPDFVAQVRTALQTSGANPQLLKLEITESLLVTDMQEVVATMQALRAEQLTFSLDDFGTGYSSLMYLKRLPLDQLKIDKSFVRDVLTDPNDAAIARTVLALGRSLGLHVVAEGVEELGQWEFLLGQGGGLFQGYLFGKPVPVAQLRLGCLAPD